MIGCSKINEVKVFERTGNYKECVGVSRLNDSCFAIDYANTDNRLAFGGGDGIVYTMKLSNK